MTRWCDVRTALDDPRYLALLNDIDALLIDPPLSRRGRRPARRELPRLISRIDAKVVRRMRRANQQHPGPARDIALHEVRKAAKRLRYATEVARPVVGKPARRLGKRAKAVQQLLGEHHDAVVAGPGVAGDRYPGSPGPAHRQEAATPAALMRSPCLPKVMFGYPDSALTRTEGTLLMSMQDKMRNKANVLKGKVKEAAGKATGNEQWIAEGKVEQGKGNLKQAGEKVKDAGRSVFGDKRDRNSSY